MTKKLKPIHIVLLIVTLPLLTGAFNEASGQSEQELRREVERLQDRNHELERELERAHRRITDLERMVERLRQAPTESRDAPPPSEEPEVTIDESVPSASPRSLFNALKESYREATQDLDAGRDGDRMRTMYLRTLERWQSRVNREMRAQINWHVHVLDAEETRAGHTLKVVAVDPITHARLGQPFDMEIPRRLARRYEQLAERDEVEVLRVRGALVPQVTINRDRYEPGPFNVPPLIGPFAEFSFRIDPTAVTEPSDPDEEERGRR